MELPKDRQTRKDVEFVLENGYIILENVFTKAEAQEAKDEIHRLSGTSPMVGRNPFEGLATNRIYSILNKTRVFDKFAVLPRVLALNDYFLDEAYLITAYHTININPNEAPQGLHHDDGFVNLPRPRKNMGTAIILAFDDFTADNGATRVIPGSHKWGSEQPKEEQTIPMVCPAGSAVYLVSTVWHGGGANRSNKPRMSATVQYCQPYLRPIENQIIAVDPRRLKDIPPRIVEMMGYRVHRPFIGYADGLNPIKAIRRYVEWLQAPLLESPPAFATTSKL